MFSHASAIRRCLDNKNVSIVSFGIRNISASEIPFLKKNSRRIKIFWAKNKTQWNLNNFKKIIKNKNVYLTFDVDGLDSSIMPATGTPEPGGLFWDETIKIINQLIPSREKTELLHWLSSEALKVDGVPVNELLKTLQKLDEMCLVMGVATNDSEIGAYKQLEKNK